MDAAWPPRLMVFVAILAMIPASVAADQGALRRIIDSDALAESPNSILLDYLLNEGRSALPPTLHQRAVDQIVRALRSHTLVDPMQGMNRMMAAVNPMSQMRGGMKNMMKQMGLGALRGATGGGDVMPGGMAQQMHRMQQNLDSALIDPWVRGLGAASTLYRAGHGEDAVRFYRGCLTSIGALVPIGSKNDWLQDQCIAGALQMSTLDAGGLFADLWDRPHMDFGLDFAAFGDPGAEMPAMPQVQAVAAHGLGKLVGTGRLTSEQHAGVMQALVRMAGTKKLDLTALTGAVQGLSFAEDRQAVEPLSRLWKKGKPQEIRPVALGGLVAGYRQSDAIKAMRKELRTGTGIGATLKKANSFAPWTGSGGETRSPMEQAADDKAKARYLAARALIRAADDAGYQFAAKYLDKRNVPEGDWDYRPDLVRDLVETSGERARSVLAERVSEGHPNEWLEGWMRAGLYEIGDRSQLAALAVLVDKRDWDFGRGTAARWYKRFKPLLWEGLKLASKSYLGMPPDEQDLRRMRQLVTNMVWAERDRSVARKTERDVKTEQFRWQLADALGEFDDPECLPILEALLGDDEPSVRLSAANALLGQSSPNTVDLLVQAVKLDYGEEQGQSRNPEIHAAILRYLIKEYPAESRTAEALRFAAGSSHPSVRFFALAAASPAADPEGSQLRVTK
jgi:hypothetical protein